MEGGSRVVQPCSHGMSSESMKIFREGIDLAVNLSLAFQHYLQHGCFGSQPSLRIQNHCDSLFSFFIQSKHPPTKIQLIPQLSPFSRSLNRLPIPLDNSIDELSDQLLAMYQECLCGDFSSIQLLREATAHRVMSKKLNNFELENTPYCEKTKELELIQYDEYWRQIDYWHKQKVANSSEIMDGSKVPQEDLMNFKANSSQLDNSKVLQGESMRVFKKGVSLLMDNLWLRHVFYEEKSGSHPSLMLKYLADVILFWFTQTIKPVSFDCIERILKNEMFFLPVTNYKGITKEVAKELMVMYEECLQGDFSSVGILEDENLAWESSSDEITVTHRPGYGTHTRYGIQNPATSKKRSYRY